MLLLLNNLSWLQGVFAITLMTIVQKKGDLGATTIVNLDIFKRPCQKLHEKPADQKPKESCVYSTKSHNNAMENQVRSVVPFSKEQLEVLQKLRNQISLHQPGASSRTRMLAQTGKQSTTLVGNKWFSKPWILNIGASNHMTGYRYFSCTNNQTVRMDQCVSLQS